MEDITLDSKVTLKEAYLIMFDFIEKFWSETGRPDALGALLGELSLWDTEQGKQPMDAAVFSGWLRSAKTVLEQEQRAEGYRNADIKLLK